MEKSSFNKITKEVFLEYCSVECTLKEIYIINYGKYGMGYISNMDIIKSIVGDDVVFTLVLENNVVTSHDLPQPLPLE